MRALIMPLPLSPVAFPSLNPGEIKVKVERCRRSQDSQSEKHRNE
jgi:hypothetical protein